MTAKRTYAFCGGDYHPMSSCKACRRIYVQRRRAEARWATKPRSMPTRASGPECPECGSVKSHSTQRGRSEPDDYFLRHRTCDGCGQRFTTVEVVIPPEVTTFARLDYRGREWRREHYRRRFAKTDIRLPVMHSDLLKVSVQVNRNPALDRRNVCSNGHELTPENTYTYPASGYRRCRICRAEYVRLYEARRREEAA